MHGHACERFPREVRILALHFWLFASVRSALPRTQALRPGAKRLRSISFSFCATALAILSVRRSPRGALSQL